MEAETYQEYGLITDQMLEVVVDELLQRPGKEISSTAEGLHPYLETKTMIFDTAPVAVQ